MNIDLYNKRDKNDIMKTNNIVKEYFKNKNRSENTIKNYNRAVKSFEERTNTNLEEFIPEALIEQSPQIIKNRLVEIPLTNLTISKKWNLYVEKSKEIGNSNSTISSNLNMIRIILTHFGIKTPKIPDLEDDQKEWYPLKKEHIKFILNTCQVPHKSLITFMASTGMRVSDAASLTIEDYMKATQKLGFHETTKLETFLKIENNKMHGFFTFYPQKTKRKKVLCKTCNSRESNYFIMLNLRRRYELTNGELKKTDALFSSRVKKHRGKLNLSAINLNFNNKKERLYDHIRMEAEEKLKNNEITEIEYEKILNELPTVTTHVLRKYFINQLAESRVPMRISSLMEGHAPSKIDRSYTNISDEVIIEEYDRIEAKLTFFKDEEEFTNEELLEENLRLKEENERIKAEIDEIGQKTIRLDEKQEETLKMIEKIIKDSGMEDTIKNFHLKK